MSGQRRGCPEDTTLEAYLYEDLPYLQWVRVRAHLAFCRACRKRLADLRDFTQMLSRIPNEEPPAGFLDDILKSMENWGDPTPAPVEEESDQVTLRGPSMKVRWALGTALFIVSTVVQWQYGEYLPKYLSGSYVSALKELGQVWEFFRSGAWWQSTLQIVQAFRTDRLGALEILGTSIPTQVLGVIVFGGIVTTVFIGQLKASRGKREGHRK